MLETESILYLSQMSTEHRHFGILIAVFIRFGTALLPANEQVSQTSTPNNRNTQVDIKCHEDQHQNQAHEHLKCRKQAKISKSMALFIIMTL